MSRFLLISVVALGVGATGCQKTAYKSAQRPAEPTASGNPIPPTTQLPPPTFTPPPPPPLPVIPTDESGGYIPQPNVPTAPPPPVRPLPPPVSQTPPPPPVPVPPPQPVAPPVQTYTPPPVNFNEPPPVPVAPVPPVTPNTVNLSEPPPPAAPQPVKVPTITPNRVDLKEPAPAPVKVPPVTPNKVDLVGEPAPKHREPIDGTCDAGPVSEPVPKDPELDILFVVDTSPSFRKGPQDSTQGGDLARLAADMPNFVRQLPAGTNYRIGVMTGNGPESRWHGRLVGGDEPAVLDSTKMSDSELGRALRNKMKNIPDDRAPGARFLSDSQGEGMLLALYDSIMNPSLRAQIKKQGLFRKNANLAIIVVSDEQDICHVYPEDIAKYRTLDQSKFDQGLVPVLKPYEEKDGKKFLEPDRKEVAAYRFCKTRNGENLNYTHVAQALRSLSAEYGIKVIANSISYLSNQGLKSIDSSQAEFEKGHGILELVREIDNGKSEDMMNVRTRNGVSFASALSSIGATTSSEMRFTTVWNCMGGTAHPLAIDNSTIEVDIIHSSEQEFKSKKFDNQGQIITILSSNKGELEVKKYGGSSPYLRVLPANPSAFKKDLEARKVGYTKQKIRFKTLRDVNPQTGKPD